MSSDFIRRQTVGRLVRQIERDYKTAKPASFAEAAFRRQAHARAALIHRAGWPDFLLDDHGSIYGVEVKAGPHDHLRKSQASTFAVLERMSMKVFVWIPQRPEVLRPWRKWPVKKRGHPRGDL